MVLHLRRDQRPIHDVPSLLLWQQLATALRPPPRRLRLPRLPWLLLLQALALVLLVLALARPSAIAATPRPGRVLVLDDSVWMSVGGRLAAAERRLAGLARALAPSTPVRIVVAQGQPFVLYQGAAGGAPAALGRVRPTTAPDTLGEALSLAAGLLRGPSDRVVLVRAPEDALPPVLAARDRFTALVVGRRLAGLGFSAIGARCGIGAALQCEIYAVVRSTAPVAETAPYTAAVDGRTVLAGRVAVPADASAAIVLSARANEQVRLQLVVPDPFPADARAWVTVPGPEGAPAPTVVTLVGTPSDALPVARALAAVPGVTLRLRTPRSYRLTDARQSDLLVLDRWLPPGRLPPAPSVVLIDPPRLPGGRVGPALGDPTVSGTDPSSALLAGVDPTGLAIAQGAGRRLVLPSFLQPVVWSPSGPLLAAGDNGRQRVAVLAFDPTQSALPQLAAFPVLVANLVGWAWGWAPSSASSGVPIAVDATPGARTLTVRRGGRAVERLALGAGPATVTLARPGLYRLTESGPGVRRSRSVTANVAALSAPSAPVDLREPGRAPPAAPAAGPTLVPWALALALLALLLEWAAWTGTRRGWAVP